MDGMAGGGGQVASGSYYYFNHCQSSSPPIAYDGQTKTLFVLLLGSLRYHALFFGENRRRKIQMFAITVKTKREQKKRHNTSQQHIIKK